MDSFELNKVTGAFLGACLFVMIANVLAGAIFTPGKPAVPGYDLPAPEEAPAAGAGAADAGAPAEPLPVRLASASVERGQAVAKQCTSCHNFEKGSANKVGPVLYDVIPRTKGAVPGFAYSAALKERAAKGETWDYAAVDAFILNPKAYLPGTSMGYAGLKDHARRADLIAYLRTLADNPAPLPTQ